MVCVSRANFRSERGHLRSAFCDWVRRLGAQKLSCGLFFAFWRTVPYVLSYARRTLLARPGCPRATAPLYATLADWCPLLSHCVVPFPQRHSCMAAFVYVFLPWFRPQAVGCLWVSCSIPLCVRPCRLFPVEGAFGVGHLWCRAPAPSCRRLS